MSAKQIKSMLTAGFSLIELMVVVAIIALLTAIAVPSYKTYIQQARAGQILNFIQNFEEQWQAVDNGSSSLCPSSAGTAGSATHIQGLYVASVQYTWNTTNAISCNSDAGAGAAISFGGFAPNGTGSFTSYLNAASVTDMGYTTTGSGNSSAYITMTPTENSFSGSGSAPQIGDRMFTWTCTVGGTGSTANNTALAALLGNLTGALSGSGDTTCTPLGS